MINESFVSSRSNDSDLLKSSINFNFNLESHIVEPNFNSIIKENPFQVDLVGNEHNTTESDLFKAESREGNTVSESLDVMKRIKHTIELKKMPLRIHGRNRVHRIKVKYLSDLTDTISGILEGREEDWGTKTLLTAQMDLLKVILKKKFKNSSKNSFLMTSLEELRNLNEISKFANYIVSTKRTEENNKFVYKHTLKYLKAKYNQENNLPFNRESEESFYKHYFGDHAAERKVQLKTFYDPLNSKSQSKSKTISNGHLILLFTCRKFKNDFFNYLDSGFKEDYQSSTFKKIEKILLELEKKLEDNSGLEKEKLIRKYISEFAQKKRVKFPWSSKEIDAAMCHFSKQVNRLLMENERAREASVAKCSNDMSNQVVYLN